MKRLREVEHEDQAEAERSIYPNAGKWVRGRLLGGGCYGSVHLATIKHPGSRLTSFPPVMAVKSTYTSKCKELENEKRLLLGCLADSPFIIRCFGEDITIAKDNQQVFNVFLEYASGGSLFDLIEKSNNGLGLHEQQVKRYTESILRGIKFIHDKGLIHCDLKPENILLVKEDEDFVAKIADFGLTKSAGRSTSQEVQGTRMYLAPECVTANYQEQRSDIWALGCIVLVMLTGRLPWDANPHDDDFKRKIIFESPVIPSDDSISKEAKDFLIKCFQKKLKNRPSAEVLLSHPFLRASTTPSYVIREELDDERRSYKRIAVSRPATYSFSFLEFFPIGFYSGKVLTRRCLGRPNPIEVFRHDYMDPF